MSIEKDVDATQTPDTSFDPRDVAIANDSAVINPPLPAAKSASLLPSLRGATPELLAEIQEVKENLASLEVIQIPRMKVSAAGVQVVDGDEPIDSIQGILIHARKANTYYAKAFNKNDAKQPPDCYSLDGIRPEADAKNIQHPTCKGCPKAEFGTNAMQTGKACRNLKPLYLLLDDQSLMPFQLSVTPTSLKAANDYLIGLTARGLSYRKVRTQITAAPKEAGDTYSVLSFKMLERLPEAISDRAEVLRAQWLPIMNAQVAAGEDLGFAEGLDGDAPRDF